jgi:phage terminase Nu1 subunit (DNA packaging protein)
MHDVPRQDTVQYPSSITKRLLATRHSVSQRTIDNWVSDGMPVLRFSRRKLLFPVSEVDAWIHARFLVSRARKPSDRLAKTAEVAR